MQEHANKTDSCPLCQGAAFGEIGRKGEQTYYRCRRCRLVIGSDLWSSTSDADAVDLYDDSYLDETRRFQPATTKRYDGILERIERVAAGRRMVEVGFGNGQFLHTARARGWDVTGVEVSRAACDWVRDQYDIRTACGLFENVSIEPGSLDAVSSMETIEHLYDPVSFVERAREVLVANGVLFLTTPNAACLTRRLIGLDWRGYTRGHTLLFTPSRLRRFLHEHGFETTHIETRTIVPHSVLRSWRKRFGPRREAGSASVPRSTMSELYEIRDRVESRRLLRGARTLVNIALNATGTGEKTLLWARKR